MKNKRCCACACELVYGVDATRICKDCGGETCDKCGQQVGWRQEWKCTDCIRYDGDESTDDDDWGNKITAPPYYLRGGIETADYIEAKRLNFNLGCVVKYVSRAGYKPGATMLDDLRKAAEHLKREITIQEKGNA